MSCSTVESPLPQWESPPKEYGVDRDAVHVWRAFYQPVLTFQKQLLEGLSDEEIDRAGRFVRQSDRDRYVFAHGTLRAILCDYAGCEPGQLVFENGLFGKPQLVGPAGSGDIQFNLSHSGDLTLVAVSRGPAVGVDVEFIREIPDASQIVERFFSVDERRHFASVARRDFVECFFAYWTSKEAFLKATGEGLTYPLDTFSVVLPGGNGEVRYTFRVLIPRVPTAGELSGSIPEPVTVGLSSCRNPVTEPCSSSIRPWTKGRFEYRIS